MNKMFSRLASYLVIFLLVIMSFSAHPADEGLAMRHYQLVTEIREGQWPVWQDEDASREDLESALAQLVGALDHLARPEVQELALGNSYLHYRVYNIRRDMMQIEAKLGRPERVVEQLRYLRHFVVGAGDHARLLEELPEPEDLREHFYARPPIRTQWIEGRVIVTGVFSARLRALGVSVGSEIESIDGEPVDAYVRQHVAPFQSASTEQDLKVRKYGYALLAGPSTRSLALSLRQPDGGSKTVEIERSGYSDVEWPESFQRRQLDGGIEYLSLDSFADGRALEAFNAAWPDIQQAGGLILDLRNNGGGSSWPGYRILAHLIDKPVMPAASWTRRNDSVRQAGSASVQFHPLSVRPIEPITEERYAGPVVLLTGPRTFSAAEDMAMAFAVSQRGVIIGQTTAGSTGQPLMFDLPGGGKARICAKRDTWPDGSPLVGVGVVPDIQVVPRVRDIEAGRDRAMEAAMKWIREQT